MAYWLLKTEPEDLVLGRSGQARRQGRAVDRRAQFHRASSNLKKMKKGDRAFFYHTGDGRQIVGIAEVIREHYPDPTDEKGEPWVVVDIKARRAAAEAGDARRGQGRAEAQGHGAGEIRAACRCSR